MKAYRWPSEKNEALEAGRGVTFEQMVIAIDAGGLVDVVEHPNKAKYPRQQIFVVAFEGYAYLVPFVEEDDHYFSKTIIPSRKATREYLGHDDIEAET